MLSQQDYPIDELGFDQATLMKGNFPDLDLCIFCMVCMRIFFIS